MDNGLIADDGVNCETAEAVGLSIQANLDNVPLSEASIKRSKKAITLATLKPSVAIRNDLVVIDSIQKWSCRNWSNCFVSKIDCSYTAH